MGKNEQRGAKRNKKEQKGSKKSKKVQNGAKMVRDYKPVLTKRLSQSIVAKGVKISTDQFFPLKN